MQLQCLFFSTHMRVLTQISRNSAVGYIRINYSQYGKIYLFEMCYRLVSPVRLKSTFICTVIASRINRLDSLIEIEKHISCFIVLLLFRD